MGDPEKVAPRPLVEERLETVEILIESQTAPAVEVQRAKTIRLTYAVEKCMAIARK